MTDDEKRVTELGDEIGFGNMMQLAERIWNKRYPGAAHSVGPCVAFLVPCACVENGQSPARCDWCCGSGRVTERVRAAIESSEAALERY